MALVAAMMMACSMEDNPFAEGFNDVEQWSEENSPNGVIGDFSDQIYQLREREDSSATVGHYVVNSLYHLQELGLHDVVGIDFDQCSLLFGWLEPEQGDGWVSKIRLEYNRDYDLYRCTLTIKTADTTADEEAKTLVYWGVYPKVESEVVYIIERE